MYTVDQLLMLVIRGLPHLKKLSAIDTTTEAIPGGQKAIRITWQGKHYRIDPSLFVEEVQGGLLASNHEALYVRRCLEKAAEKFVVPF